MEKDGEWAMAWEWLFNSNSKCNYKRKRKTRIKKKMIRAKLIEYKKEE
jgi:hypothetical protein